MVNHKKGFGYFSGNHFLGFLDGGRPFSKAFLFGAHKSKSILEIIFLGPPFPTAEQVHPRVPELLIKPVVY